MKNILVERLVLAGLLAAASMLALLGVIVWRSVAAPEDSAGVVMFGMSFPLLLFFLFLHISRATRLLRDNEALLKSAMLELEDASRRKSEFLAYMSHELRTPINSIMGFSQLLREECRDKLTGPQAEYADDIYSNGQHLLSLVNNILDLSKIEAGKMTIHLDSSNISELVESSLSIIKEKVVSQRVQLHLDVQPGLGAAHVDTLMFKQILHNLLSNAVKYSRHGGQLSLCVRRVARVDVGRVSGDFPSRTFPLADSEFNAFLEVGIADNGIGISGKGLEQLFMPYSRIDAGASNKFEGTGLGLALVRRLAELHSGTVAVESAEGHGSRFIVWLPLRTETGAAASPIEPTPIRFAHMAIRHTRKIRAGMVPEPVRQGMDARQSFALN